MLVGTPLVLAVSPLVLVDPSVVLVVPPPCARDTWLGAIPPWSLSAVCGSLGRFDAPARALGCS